MPRQFGRAVKMHSGTCIERMFFTGVMQVAWSDASSSLNTVKDLTGTNAFRDTLGFKSSDIAELLALLFPGMGPEARAKHLESTKCTSNEYRHSSAQVEGLYSPQGVWHYMKQLKDMGDQMVPRMDPNIAPPARDKVAAFLVQHAVGEFILHYIFSIRPLGNFMGCFQQLRRRIRHCTSSTVRSLSLLSEDSPQSPSSTHYCGYLSYKYSKDEVHGDVLVAPNDEMRDIFMDAVLHTIPREYQVALEWKVKNVPRAVALTDAYNAYVARNLE